VLCDDLKRYAEALQVCDNALAQGVSTPGIWAVKGDALNGLGRADEARIAYEQVLNFPREDYLSWASSGSALAGLGRFEEALDAYEHAFTLKQDDPLLWRKLAEVLRALGRDDEALAAEKHAEELER
jgi:tetratricopeptide (TPR) repeat protein